MQDTLRPANRLKTCFTSLISTRDGNEFVTMKLRHVLKTLTLSLIAIPSFALAEEKPNIVVILTDDQGYADVSYNPHSPPEVSTPNIDALAHLSLIHI